MKFVMPFTLGAILMGSWAQAATLTPETLVGRYAVEVKVGFQKVYVKFRVLDTRHFELQRTYPDGHSDESCDGIYSFHNEEFDGTFTCPSNRSRDIQFSLDFQDKRTEELSAGTSVPLVISLAPRTRLNAYMKKY